jgi:hypothetical protein
MSIEQSVYVDATSGKAPLECKDGLYGLLTAGRMRKSVGLSGGEECLQIILIN